MNSTEQKSEAINLAQAIHDRFLADRLTRVSLLHLDELPTVSGVYFASTGARVLYIGKANNLAQRCRISNHHKLPAAIERGAMYLYVAAVPKELAWAVEQWLIHTLKPPLNESVSAWWLRRVTPVRGNLIREKTRRLKKTASARRDPCQDPDISPPSKGGMLPKEFAGKYGINAEMLAKLLSVSLSSTQKWLAPQFDREVPTTVQASLDALDDKIQLWVATHRSIESLQSQLEASQSKFPIALIVFELWLERLSDA